MKKIFQVGEERRGEEESIGTHLLLLVASGVLGLQHRFQPGWNANEPKKFSR